MESLCRVRGETHVTPQICRSDTTDPDALYLSSPFLDRLPHSRRSSTVEFWVAFNEIHPPARANPPPPPPPLPLFPLFFAPDPSISPILPKDRSTSLDDPCRLLPSFLPTSETIRRASYSQARKRTCCWLPLSSSRGLSPDVTLRYNSYSLFPTRMRGI